MKICGVYKITNTITGDFYIGSSKNVKRRWAAHKWPSKWNDNPNNPLYLDFQKYGIDKFEFEIIAEVVEEKLKETEQQFIEKLKPTYNSCNAKGWNFERYKEWQKEYNESHKEEISEQKKQYYESHKEEISEQMKQYYESHKEEKKKYNNQLCSYNGEMLTLGALVTRFRRAGIPHSTQEAKKYLLQ